MIFTELSIPERIRVIHDTQDTSLLVDLFARYLNMSSTEVAEKYTLSGDFCKNVLTIKGSSEDLYKLGIAMLSTGLTLDCCNSIEIRVDIYAMLDKLK